MYVNPGELNKKIQIVQYKEFGEDKDGFPMPPERIVVRDCYASVRNTSGGEVIKANSEFSEVKKRFLVRWSKAEINTDMVVAYKGKEYDIEYINNFGDGNKYLEIYTSMKERV